MEFQNSFKPRDLNFTQYNYMAVNYSDIDKI